MSNFPDQSQSPDSCCSICVEKYKPGDRSRQRKIECPFCHKDACFLCFKTYLLGLIEDPHCMFCRVGWNIEILHTLFPQTFIMGELKKQRQEILFQREKAYLPLAQEDAARLLERKKIENKIFDARQQKKDNHEQINWYKTRYEKLEKKDSLGKHYRGKATELRKKNRELNVQLNTLHHKLNGRDGFIIEDIPADLLEHPQGAPPEHKKPPRTRKCPHNECRGFLDEKFFCSLCERKTCKKCYVSKAEGTKHSCKKEDVATYKLMKEDSKPCPKCGMMINKIEGCSQIWCVLCHTAFNYHTGEIEKGKIHNPHYFEWRHRQGLNPHVQHDIAAPCGGLPRYFRATDPKASNIAVKYNEYLRLFYHFQGNNYGINTEPHRQNNRDVQIQYLQGEMDEPHFKSALANRERSYERKYAFYQVYQMIEMAAIDIFQRMNIVISAPKLEDKETKQLKELEKEFFALVNYYDSENLKVSKRFNNCKSHLFPRKLDNKQVIPSK